MPVGLTLVYANSGNPGVLPPQSHAFGKTYAQWTVAWWQWMLSTPSSSNPVFDETGANCEIGQSGPVWFLAGTVNESATRTCTIPTGKALFFPILNVEADYPCPAEYNFEPAPGQSLEDFLTESAKAWLQVRALNVEIDGVPLQNLFGYRVTSPLFTFTGNTSLTHWDPCITGEPQPAVSDGYWIMLAPLSAGNHTLHFHGAATSWGTDFDVDVTYNLTVAH
jgi:hypothetical protein